ncbi:MAG: hypothetical protein ACRDZ9_00010 [Acidimicrobiales bacterium]
MPLGPEEPVGGADAAPALTLAASVRLARRYAEVERVLFEVLGGWVATVVEPDVKLHLATHGPHHAWHAELWQRVHDGSDPPDPPGGGAALAEALAGPVGPGHTLGRLVAAYRVVVPRMVGAYAEHLRRTSPVSDGPVVRALRLTLRDELDEWAGGEWLVQALVRDGDDADAAAARQAHLERLVVETGLLPGAPPATTSTEIGG